jgi:phosphoglucosamine mutase
MSCAPSELLGKARRLDDARGRYIEFCKSTFPASFDLHGLKLVVDCAHGAAYDVAPQVFHELGAEVVTIGVSPNGFNINDGVGATAPDALVRAVKEHRADIGIALDGDADRLQVVDASGRLYNGDELLYVLVKDRIATDGHVDGAVGTLMTNMAVEVALKQAGVQFVRAAVGDRYVLEKLRENNWMLGAEGSGHILSLDRHSTGDGIVSALLVLAAIKRGGKPLADLLDGVTLFPQKLINVRMQPGRGLEGQRRYQAGDCGRGACAGNAWPGADSRVGHGARVTRDGGGSVGGGCDRARRKYCEGREGRDDLSVAKAIGA